MFALLSYLPPRRLLVEQLPAFAGAFILASLYYQFHSFAWECLAFLGTWFVLDALLAFLRGALLRPAVTVRGDD